MSEHSCCELRSDGLPCRNRPLRGSDRCRWHQRPEISYTVTLNACEEDLACWTSVFECARKGERSGTRRDCCDTLVLQFGWHIQYELQAENSDEPVVVRAPRFSIPTVFHPVDNHAFCIIGKERIPVAFRSDWIPILQSRNDRLGVATVSNCYVGPVRSKAPAIPASVVASSIPSRIIQVTSEESRALVEAITSGQSGKGWRCEEDRSARVYISRSGRHEVWLVQPDSDRDGNAGSSLFDNVLSSWNLNVAFLALVVLGTLADAAVRHRSEVANSDSGPVVELPIDDLLSAIGVTYSGSKSLHISRRGFNSNKERNEWRRWVREQLLILSHASIVGRRYGVYRDPVTRETIDTYLQGTLFRVIDCNTEWEHPTLVTSDESVPTKLQICGGELFRDIASNQSLLQYIGNLKALAGLTPGRATGQWARAIGLAYAQVTRERYKNMKKVETCTRRELLTRFAPTPSVDDIVSGSNPRRLLDYWQSASDELERIGWWKVVKEPPVPGQRYHWADKWLNQSVFVAPGASLQINTSLNYSR